MCSYLFVAMAYGMMMQEAGFAWYDSLLASITIYTGAFQFVLITFLSSGASVLTIAVTALLMNSRQAFYSLSFVDEFKKMGRKMPYMIHTMTDETYAVNCTLTEQGEERRGGRTAPRRKKSAAWLCFPCGQTGTYTDHKKRVSGSVFFCHGAVCDRSHRLLGVLFSGNTKSKPHDPGNAVYETAVKWYNDVT